ncbi:hypothetical protein D9615_000488 [Tricholomella constricta]|uniref:Uncharacterized protein n=1 Tax=Tricholomella constricta TaxID=117010 RepID=A0A8H5HRW2_9AGAR|nr:hypothetical protein D9615_000488 [Tricholomella constricta]
MDFIPRYAQPFTLADAVRLDVAVITEEIARLQNSLQHLKQTQTVLQENIDVEPPEAVDPDILKALEENKIVIGSQEERILILKLALTEKGIHFGSHYDLDSSSTTTPVPAETPSAQLPSATTTDTFQVQPDDEDGIHL